jgi:hypothetical protein
MSNRIRLNGTTANSFQIGLKGAGFSSSEVTTPYTLKLPAELGTDGQFIQTDANGNLSFANIDTNKIENGTSNVAIADADGNVTIGVNGQADVAVFSSDGTNALAQFAGDVVVAGNFTVDGTTTYVNVNEVSVEDPIITLGTGPNGAPLIIDDGKDRGVALKRYGDYHEYLATADSAINDTTITLNTVTDLTIGQVLINPSLVIGTVVTDITGLVVTLSAGLAAAVAIDDKFTYGADTTSFMGWDNVNSTFAIGSDVSITDNIATINTYGNLQAQTVNAEYFQGVHRGATQDLAVNKSGVDVEIGQVVFINGAQGNRISFKLAQANTEANSAGTFGFVTSTINNNQEGYIQNSGTLGGLNTFGLVAGAPVYLSSTVAGGWTTVKPVAPQHTVILGWIERVHATVGSIYVKVDNGYELDELHNVKITYYANANANANLMNGQVLAFDSANSIWINRPTKIYTDEYHVDPVNGIDEPTQSGSYDQPFLTITYALSRMSVGTGQSLVLHDGSYPEAVVVNKFNLEIRGATNTGGLVLLTGAWSFSNTGSSVRCWSLNWSSAASIAITGAGSVYFRNCIASCAITKSGGGYVQVDAGDFAGAGVSITGAGTVLVQQSMLNFPVLNNASAVLSVIGSAGLVAPVITAGTAVITESFVYSTGTTANAVTGGASAAVYLYNSHLVSPSATVARVSFPTGFYSINNTQFDRANSNVAGTNLGTVNYFDAVAIVGPNSNVYTSTSDLELNSGNVIVRKSAYPVYQPVINNTLATPPTTPATDDRYLVAAAPTGAWSTFVNQLVTWSGTAWVSSGAPVANDTITVTSGTNAGRMYTWSGTAWTINAQPQSLKVTPWALNAAYPTGTIVLKEGVFYQAAGTIAANTVFANGVSGAKWKPVGGSGSGSGNAITNGTSNVSIATANGNITMSVANIANVVVVSGNTDTTGNFYTTTSTANIQSIASLTRNTNTNTISNTTVVTSNASITAGEIEIVATGNLFANATNLSSTVVGGDGNIANTSFLVTGTNANSMFYAQSQSANANANIYMAATSVNGNTRIDVRALGNTANANMSSRVMIEAVGSNAGIVLAASTGLANANVLTITPANVTFGNTTIVKYANVSNVASANASNVFYPLVLDAQGVVAKQPVVSSLSPVIDNTLLVPPTSPSIDDSYLIPATGATDAWLNQGNKIATWTGSAWSFYTPSVNDVTTILTGTNAGTAYLWNGTAWTVQSVNSSLPLSNWTLSASYLAGSIVVYNSSIYQANGAVPADTAFVVGTTGATWKLLNSTGSTKSIAKYTRSTTQTGVAANSVVICNVAEQLSGTNISVNTTTGSITLTAGVTYRLRGTVGMISHSSATGAMSYQWWDVTAGAFRGQGGGILSAEGTGQQYAWQSGTAEWVFTPSVTTVVQLRVVGVNNASTIVPQSGASPISNWKIGAPFIDIEQLGTTNTTAFTGVITNSWTIANSYSSGTIVVKDSFLYQANEFIVSGTAFVVGTTGATWKAINPPILTSPNGTNYRLVVANDGTLSTTLA